MRRATKGLLLREEGARERIVNILFLFLLFSYAVFPGFLVARSAKNWLRTVRSVELFGSFCLVFFRCIGDATENASKATLFFPEEEGLLLVVVSKMLLWETQFSQIVRASFVVVTTPCLLAFLCQWEFPRGLHIFFFLFFCVVVKHQPWIVLTLGHWA